VPPVDHWTWTNLGVVELVCLYGKLNRHDAIDHEEVLHLIVLSNFLPGFALLEDGFNDVE
jgi:hypothetical protein